MKNQFGPPVDGDDFYGRNDELAYLQQQLENQNVLLLGPRRLGKTSICRRICELLQKQKWRAFEVNVAGCSDELSFIEKLMDGVKENASSGLIKITSSIWDGIKTRVDNVKLSYGEASAEIGFGKSPTESWTDIASDLLEKLTDLDGKWLIYLDELPVFLFKIVDKPDGDRRVKDFLDWFRNDVRLSVKLKSITWLISGSVGLDSLVQRYRMPDTINDIAINTLEPFPYDEADQFLSILSDATDIGLSDEDRKQVLDGIGWTQPYYIQLAVQQLRKPQVKKIPNSKERIKSALAQMIDPNNDNDFHHWESRLETQLGKADANLCRELLTSVAKDPKGATGQTLSNVIFRKFSADPLAQKNKYTYLRDILIRDAYIWSDDSGDTIRYRFRLELLRLWWLRRNTV